MGPQQNLVQPCLGVPQTALTLALSEDLRGSGPKYRQVGFQLKLVLRIHLK